MIRFLSFFLATSLSFAASTVEVVVTNPLETDLAVSGTRDTQAVWIEMFKAARERIDIEQFYVSDQKGEALGPVLDAIREAAARGVKVRLLVDKKFFGTYPETVKEIGGLLHAESRIIDFASTKGVQHAKFFIVDGKESYVGSANFDWRALAHIHELGLRVTDSKVSSELNRVFDMDWAKGEPLRGSGTDSFPLDHWAGNPLIADLELVASPQSILPSGVRSSLDAIIDTIENAKTAIRVQVYEYSTSVFGESGKKWLDLDEALKRAARRGVKVDLMVDSTKVGSAKSELSSLAKQKNVTVKSIAIPQASSGPIPYARLIHSKYMLVDGQTSWVGTDNWSKGYFLNSRGVAFLSSSEELASLLDKVYERLWTSPYAAIVK